MVQLKSRLLVLTSTFPRWKNDSTPSFVLDFCRSIKPHMQSVSALAPHYKSARVKETVDNIKVKRFRYWFAGGENIAGDGAAANKIKASPIYALKLLSFLTSLFISTLYLSLKPKTIINAHWLIPQGFIAVIVKTLTRRKVVVTIHGGDVFALNQGIFRRIKRYTLKKADAIIVNSSATQNACQDLYPGRDYPIIPMGIDIEKFSKPKIEEIKKVKDKYKLNSFTVLFIGRLSEEKGVIFLIEALEKLKKEKREFKALIVGEGSEKPKLEKAIKDKKLEDSVILTGWVDSDEVPFYYAAADVFVGPSIISTTGWQEAFGLVFAESLASGTPVIGTRTGGIKDIVVNGKNGFLVDDKDSDKIADKLRKLMDEPQLLKSMQRNAQQHMTDNFSWETTTKRYKEIFARLG